MQTTQSIFETVARHLFAQGERAVVAGSCKYRTPEGLMCAMGVLIPDSLYYPGLEGNTASGIFAAVPQLNEEFSDEQKALIGDLQWLHDDEDSWESSETLTNALIETGAKHGLSVEFIDGLYFGMNK